MDTRSGACASALVIYFIHTRTRTRVLSG